MPRILCIVEDLGAGGGAEQLLTTLLPEIRNLGFDVVVVALFDYQPDLGSLLEEQGFLVHRLHLTRRWGILTGLRKLWSLFRAERYDLTWGHLFFGNLYAVLFALTRPRTKSIITLHSEGYEQAPPTTNKARLFVMIEKWALGLSTAKAAVSNAVARSYAGYFGWRGIDVVHNGVVTRDIPPAPSAEQRYKTRLDYGVSADDFLIVTPARFVPKKGHAVLLDALGLLKVDKGWSPKLLACGAESVMLNELRAQAARLKLMDSVRFCAQLWHSELFPLIQAADVVILPSLREPFGMAAAEAMVLGAPVILTRVDGFIEQVGDSECALLVPPGDERALAEAIWKLRADPVLRRQLAERGRLRIIENFDVSLCARRWAGVFDRLAHHSC
jgi:glycosyltransferase involved in cell wall biosynthesis